MKDLDEDKAQGLNKDTSSEDMRLNMEELGRIINYLKAEESKETPDPTVLREINARKKEIAQKLSAMLPIEHDTSPLTDVIHTNKKGAHGIAVEARLFKHLGPEEKEDIHNRLIQWLSSLTIDNISSLNKENLNQVSYAIKMLSTDGYIDYIAIWLKFLALNNKNLTESVMRGWKKTKDMLAQKEFREEIEGNLHINENVLLFLETLPPDERAKLTENLELISVCFFAVESLNKALKDKECKQNFDCNDISTMAETLFEEISGEKVTEYVGTKSHAALRIKNTQLIIDPYDDSIKTEYEFLLKFNYLASRSKRESVQPSEIAKENIATLGVYSPLSGLISDAYFGVRNLPEKENTTNRDLALAILINIGEKISEKKSFLHTIMISFADAKNYQKAMEIGEELVFKEKFLQAAPNLAIIYQHLLETHLLTGNMEEIQKYLDKLGTLKDKDVLRVGNSFIILAIDHALKEVYRKTGSVESLTNSILGLLEKTPSLNNPDIREKIYYRYIFIIENENKKEQDYINLINQRNFIIQGARICPEDTELTKKDISDIEEKIETAKGGERQYGTAYRENIGEILNSMGYATVLFQLGKTKESLGTLKSINESEIYPNENEKNNWPYFLGRILKYWTLMIKLAIAMPEERGNIREEIAKTNLMGKIGTALEKAKKEISEKSEWAQEIENKDLNEYMNLLKNNMLELFILTDSVKQ